MPKTDKQQDAWNLGPAGRDDNTDRASQHHQRLAILRERLEKRRGYYYIDGNMIRPGYHGPASDCVCGDGTIVTVEDDLARTPQELGPGFAEADEMYREATDG